MPCVGSDSEAVFGLSGALRRHVVILCHSCQILQFGIEVLDKKRYPLVKLI